MTERIDRVGKCDLNSYPNEHRRRPCSRCSACSVASMKPKNLGRPPQDRPPVLAAVEQETDRNPHAYTELILRLQGSISCPCIWLRVTRSCQFRHREEGCSHAASDNWLQVRDVVSSETTSCSRLDWLGESDACDVNRMPGTRLVPP